MTNISFSICIPNFNYAQYIGETIQSVLDQTYQNFEIIIADNASTDNSVEVVQSFDDNRIRLAHGDRVADLHTNFRVLDLPELRVVHVVHLFLEQGVRLFG